MEITGFLFTGPPSIVGEILRGVAFPYMDERDLREGDDTDDERLRVLCVRLLQESATAAVSFNAWDVEVDTVVRWDGDGGMIAFFLDAQDGRKRVLVSHDPKTDRWVEGSR